MISLRHVGLIVKNIDSSYKLYRDILGFEPKIDHIEKGSFYEHLTGIRNGVARTSKCYSKDGTCIELIEYVSHAPEKREKGLLSEGFNHIAINVDDVDLICESITSIGLKLVNEPITNDEKTAKVAFCYDFEGNMLELVQTQNLK